MVDSLAPGFTMPETTISNGILPARSLDDANFENATIRETSFATARLRRANFHGATSNDDNFGFSGLQKAKLDHSRHRPADHLLLANLTGACPAGPDRGDDEMEECRGSGRRVRHDHARRRDRHGNLDWPRRAHEIPDESR